jgi:hypothetical protein
MDKLLFDNPILIKHIRSRTRKSQLMPTLLIVFILSCCIMWGGYEGQGLKNGVTFGILFVMMAIVMQLGGTSQVASSMGQTNDSGVLDFHRISPLPASVATVGFILGAPIREWLVVAVATPFVFYCAVVGVPGFFGFLKCMLILFTTSLLFHTFAVSSGLLTPKGKTRGANIGQVALLIIATLMSGSVYAGFPIPGLLTIGPTFLDAVGIRGRQGDFPTFFGVELPIFLQTLCYQIPLLAFLFFAAVRRMRSPQLPLFAKLTAAGLMVTISVLNLGGIVGHKKLVADVIIPTLLYINVAIAIMLTLAVTPDQTKFRNGFRRFKKLGMVKPALWTDWSSNRAVVLVFCGITWATAQSVTTFLADNIKFDEKFLMMTLTAVCTIGHFGAASQYFRLRFGRRGKVAIFLFCFLFWLLPLILSVLVRISIGAEAGRYVGAISPILGIQDAGLPGLIPAATLAVIFGVFCFRQEKIIQDSVNMEMDPKNFFIDEDEFIDE